MCERARRQSVEPEPGEHAGESRIVDAAERGHVLPHRLVERTTLDVPDTNEDLRKRGLGRARPVRELEQVAEPRVFARHKGRPWGRGGMPSQLAELLRPPVRAMSII